MQRIEGTSIIITGAGSGLGRAAAIQIAKKKGKTALVDVNTAGLQVTETAIRELAPSAEILSLRTNVANEAEVEEDVAENVKRFGSIDGFFKNSGIEGQQNPTEDFGSDESGKVVGINLNGVFHGLKHVLKIMRTQDSGSVVNTVSVGGIRGWATSPVTPLPNTAWWA